MDFDDVLADVGDCHRYQKLMLCFVLLPGILPCGFHAYNQLFMSLVPEHWCLIPELLQLNYSADVRRRLAVPPSSASATAPHVAYSKCLMYDVNYTKMLAGLHRHGGGSPAVAGNATKLPWTPNASWSTVPCRHGWEYRIEKPSSSVVSEWDLVCGRDFLVMLSLSIFAIGGFIGNVTFGYLQERLGCRPCFFIYLLILSVFGTATAFSTDFVTWTVLRFFNGFAVPAIIGTPYVLAVELVGPSKRTQTTVVTNLVYSLILVLLSVVAFLVQEWHQLALATTVPFVAFFLYWWVLPESPRWLLAHGKFEEIEKIIRTIAHVNHRPLPPDYMAALKRRFQVENSIKDGKEFSRCTPTISDLIRTPNIRKKTILVTYLWFATCCGYVGLTYYSTSLSGDQRFNFLVSALAELPSYVFLWPSMEYWGRKWTICWSLLLSGVACIITMLVQKGGVFMIALYAVGKFGMSSAFTIVPLMASELYPAVIRGIGLNFSSFISMFGPVVIPFIIYLDSQMPMLPLAIMGCLAVLGGFFCLALPETLNQRLPQTLRDGEEMGKDALFYDLMQCCPQKHTYTKEPSIQGEDDDPYSEGRSESPLRSLLEQQGILQSLANSNSEVAVSSTEDDSSKKTVMVTVL